MTGQDESERSRWLEVTELMEAAHAKEVTLGRHVGYWFRHSPRRALHALSYYKFAAKLIGKFKRVLDVGCGEGLGTWLLAVECGHAEGLDTDEAAIAVAQANWEHDGEERITFRAADFLAEAPVERDAVVSFDVVEHILPEHVEEFWMRVTENLAHDGIAVVGTPSLTSQQYASAVSRAGHVNVYDGERLEAELRRHFGHVFLFAANDEVVHTGFLPMAHYLIAVGCRKR